MTPRLLPLVCACAGLALADGGAVQLQKQAGPFIITLFSNPAEMRVGKVELNVLVQESGNRQTVSTGQVLIHLRRPGGSDIMEFVLPAKQNGTQYSAAANIPSEGQWPVRIDVRRGKDEATVTGVLKVLPPEPAIVAHWPFFVAVPLMALLFAINLRLRRGRALRHPRAKS